MTARHAEHGHGHRPPARYLYRALAGFIVASGAFAAVFVTLTLSAYHQPAPHELPVGIVGSAAAGGKVEYAVDSAAPGAFSFQSYPTEAGAVAAIARRQVDGALVISGDSLRLLVARGGGSGPEQALTGAFQSVAAHSGRPLVVSDVVPPLARDTQALSPFFIVLAALIPSLAAGSASALAFRRARPGLAVAAPVAAAVVIGVVAAGIADGIAGLGNYAAIAGIVILFSLAVAAPTAALARTWPPLVALALLAFIVFGIPVSGGPANLASFTPGFLRVLNPALPLGVAGGAIRDVVYFGGYGATPYVWTLVAWSLAGLVGLILLTALRRPDLAPAGPGTPALVPAQPVPGLPRRVPADAVTDPGPGHAISLVVGFDDSEPARRALIWGADLLKARPGTLHVIYADHVLIDSDLSGFAHAEMEEARDVRAASVAEAAEEIATSAGVPFTFERRQGAAAEAILYTASLHHANEPASTPLIVTGRSHHAAHHIIGSVPVRLMHQSPYPVLTIS